MSKEEICENCRWYDDSDSYAVTGYCTLNFDYTFGHDCCEDFEDDELEE